MKYNVGKNRNKGKGDAVMALQDFLRRLVPFKAKIASLNSSPKEQEKPKDKNEAGEKKEDKHITKLDSKGVPYRDCPACEGKMYKDKNSRWTCDKIGYSYDE